MREDVIDKVLQIINCNMENTELSAEQIEEDLSILGMDSIAFIHIVVALEEEFDIEIPDEYLLLTEMNTISKIAEVISATLDNQNKEIGE